MKVRITFMKAPWPQGAGVGDVVEVKGDVIPGWAAGKCVRVADDVAVTAKAKKAEPKKGDEAPAT